DNIEIAFFAAPDAGVSFVELQTAFEATLAEVANGGIPEATYSRVLKRFDGFWPDWDEEDETARWMADYVLDRVSNLREPLSERELIPTSEIIDPYVPNLSSRLMRWYPADR
ncbi:MAG: hypothetical protein QF863_09790, partial [Pseudomonadales bacterium]|nr:hypothetical protein [Pseudomonadales bacterium]